MEITKDVNVEVAPKPVYTNRNSTNNGSTAVDDTPLQSGSVLGKFSCPSCGSNDNLVVYVKHDDDGNEYLDASCFTPDCENKYVTEAQLKEQGVLDEGFKAPKTKKVVRTPITREQYDVLIAKCKQYSPSGSPHDTTMKDGSLYRGFKTETAKFYGHLYERNSNGEIIREYYPETQTGYKAEKLGSLRGYKSRTLPKIFGTHNIGVTGSSNGLSGQHLFKTGGKYVLITGGEADKVAAAQMLHDYQVQRGQGDYDRTAIVGVHVGEGTLAKVCAAQYEWLDTFEEIIICMDSDEAGDNAMTAALKVLPEGKVKIMKTSMKDANAMLLAGKQKQFISNFYDAKPLVETGIKSAAEAALGVREHLLAEKITLPPQMSRLQTAMRGGIRSTGAIVNIIGDTSIGKSFFSDTLLHHFIYHSPVVPTVLTIERTGAELMLDLYSYHIEQNLTWFEDGQDAVDFLDQPEIIKMCEDLHVNEFGEPRFHVIDDRSGDIKELEKQLEKAMKQNGSRLFILDILTDVIRSLPLAEQENHMLFQKQMKKEGAIFINILHTRKPSSDGSKGKKEDEDESNFRRVDEYDILGSGTIPQSADINIVLNRNKMAKDMIIKNTTYVDMPKCRGGATGSDICELLYDPETRKQYDKYEWMEQQRSNF